MIKLSDLLSGVTRDPHFLGGAYTLGNIPPSAITNVEPYKNK
jgi:hypothetical protein